MRANKNGVNKDQKDKVKKDGYNRGQHCVYCLTYHMIFVTHYRKPVINDEMSAAWKERRKARIEECRNWMPEPYRITPEELEEINQLLEEMDKMEQRGGRGSRGR